MNRDQIIKKAFRNYKKNHKDYYTKREHPEGKKEGYVYRDYLNKAIATDPVYKEYQHLRKTK